MLQEKIDSMVEDMRRWCEIEKVPRDAAVRFLENFRNTLTAPQEDFGASHVTANPLGEFLSVTVRPKGGTRNVTDIIEQEEQPWEIYGTVEAFDGQGILMEFFKQPEEDPVTIPFSRNVEGTYFLPLVDDGPIENFFPLIRVHINLMDRVRGIELAKGGFSLDYRGEYNYDSLDSNYLENDHAVVGVHHITYRAAVTAKVEVVLTRNRPSQENNNAPEKESHSQDENDVFQILGDIVAFPEMDDTTEFMHLPRVEKEFHSLARFENLEEVKIGTSIKLLRSYVSVPAHSSLITLVNLAVHGYGNVNIRAMFEAYDSRVCNQDFDGPNGVHCQVRVSWSHAYYSLNDEDDANVRIDNPNQPKKHQSLYDQQPSIKSCLYNKETTWQLHSETMLEIFSVFIGLNKNDQRFSIVGTIEAIDTLDTQNIFEVEESCPEILSCSRTISIRGPSKHSFVGSIPVIGVDLKNIDGSDFCKGYVEWNHSSLELPMSWYKQRICSSIRGRHGYALVYHSIFSNAVQAMVKVVSGSSVDQSTNICGTIVARYDDCEYATSYERDYFQSVLFSKSSKSPVELSGKVEKELDLLKSLVAVPRDYSLVIDVNLQARLKIDSSDYQVLRGSAEFEVGRDLCWQFQSQDFFINVTVEWGNVGYQRLPKKST